MQHTVNAKKELYQIKCAGKALVIFLLLLVLLASPFALTAKGAAVSEVLLTASQRLLSDESRVPQGESFTYLLRAKTAAAPMPDGSDVEGFTFTIEGSSSMEIGPMRFFSAGIYVYELHCTTADRSGWIIDRRVYTIEIHISAELTSTVLLYGADGVKVSEIRFTHIYGVLASDPDAMVDPPVIKIIDGNPRGASTFTFTLTAENRLNPMPSGSVSGVKRISVIGAGRAAFGTWSYTEPGVYRYTVAEVNAAVAGYLYDRTVYTITDRVSAANGQLVVTRQITSDSGEQVSTLTFVNIYEGDSLNTGRPQTPGEGPKTGDFSNPLLWTVLFFASATLLMLLIVFGYRSRKSHKQGGD